MPKVQARHTLISAAVLCVLWCASGCTLPPPQRVYDNSEAVSPAQATYTDVVSVYEEPPLEQPPPIAVEWAPPPMLVEAPPPSPFVDAVWIGGYWGWQDRWVWCTGRWAPPPRPHYGWVNPYYEHRGGMVIFIGGHWAAPGVAFIPPPPDRRIPLAVISAGVRPGPRPVGPPGIFVPPPPGSRPGLIVPAPFGTSPSVVVSAPPIRGVGMEIQFRANNNNGARMPMGAAESGQNVMIVGPAGAMANGRAFQSQVPSSAHLAAGLPPMVQAPAPRPGRPPLGFTPIPAQQQQQSFQQMPNRNGAATTPYTVRERAPERMAPPNVRGPAEPLSAPPSSSAARLGGEPRGGEFKRIERVGTPQSMDAPMERQRRAPPAEDPRRAAGPGAPREARDSDRSRPNERVERSGGDKREERHERARPDREKSDRR